MEESTARELLERERGRLEQIRDHRRGPSDEFGLSRVSEVDPMGADAGTEVFDREIDHSLVGHAESELREIEAALRRLERGEYGRCQECGRLIPDERLEVVPATRYCVAHQGLAEARTDIPRRGPGGPTARG